MKGEPLDAARAALARYYKEDEAFAFDLLGFAAEEPGAAGAVLRVAAAAGICRSGWRCGGMTK